MTGRTGYRPKCEPGCTCGHHARVEVLTNDECYERAAPLRTSDFDVLAKTFGFASGLEVEAFAIRQQWKDDRRNHGVR
jgi:hypothetical protein